MADDERTYEYRTVKAIRGMESQTEAKWERDGWEVIDRVPGKLRTEIKFRKPRMKLSKRTLAIVGAGVAVLLVFIGIIAAIGGNGGSEDTAKPSVSVSAAPEAEASAPAQVPAPVASEAEGPEILTVENNADLAALLATSDYCSESIASFAEQYAGATIEFAGNIATMNPHGTYDTRHDLLIGAGDYSETSSIGPAFQFRDVGLSDMNFVGDDIPDSYGTGDNLLVTADVDEFVSQQCLFLLEPVETRFR